LELPYSADTERALISKIVETGGIVEASGKYGIEVDHWADDECRDVYEIVLLHWRLHNSPPSKNVVRRKYRELLERRLHEGLIRAEQVKDFVFDPAEDALSYYAEEFMKDVRWRNGRERLTHIANALKDRSRLMDLEKEFLNAGKIFAQLSPGFSVYRFSEMEHRVNEYEIAKAEDRPPGIMTGFPTLDGLMHGFQPGQTAVIAAPTGYGKTTLTQAMLFNAYIQKKTPLLFPCEMSGEEVYSRWDAMATKVSRKAMKALTLSDADVEHWKYVAKRAKEASGEHDILVPRQNCAGITVERIWAEVSRHEPDIVAVDYIGLMSTPKNLVGHQGVAYNVDQLKINAVSTSIPHIVVAQTNRDGFNSGVQTSNIGESIRISQTCDLMIGLWRDDDMKSNQLMKLSVPKHRNGEEHMGFDAHWDPDIMTFYELGHEEMLAHSFLNGRSEITAADANPYMA
jgi:replicative DNA helicase